MSHAIKDNAKSLQVLIEGEVESVKRHNYLTMTQT